MFLKSQLLYATRFAVKFMVILAVMLLLLLAAVSCGGDTDSGAADPPGEDNGTEPGDDNGDAGTEPEEVDYAELGVNELGEILVLMYHKIGESEKTLEDRTRENFRKDLERLYTEGYRPILMSDYLDGNIDIPAGTSPVVLTFDDSTPCQFRFIEQDGEPVVDPDCAVGILEQFYEEHPDFGLAATFYPIAVSPFGQPEYVQEKLDYLVERGFEIGSHTYSHGNLRRLSPEAARKELAYFVKWLHQYLPGYPVRSLALPYGAHPDDLSYIFQGSYEGIEYLHEGILLAGWKPAPSPLDSSFVPTKITRIWASELKEAEGFGIADWMDWLLDNPEKRYVSDGNPDTVVVPEALKERVNEQVLRGKELITY